MCTYTDLSSMFGSSTPNTLSDKPWLDPEYIKENEKGVVPKSERAGFAHRLPHCNAMYGQQRLLVCKEGRYRSEDSSVKTVQPQNQLSCKKMEATKLDWPSCLTVAWKTTVLKCVKTVVPIPHLFYLSSFFEFFLSFYNTFSTTLTLSWCGNFWETEPWSLFSWRRESWLHQWGCALDHVVSAFYYVGKWTQQIGSQSVYLAINGGGWAVLNFFTHLLSTSCSWRFHSGQLNWLSSWLMIG